MSDDVLFYGARHEHEIVVTRQWRDRVELLPWRTEVRNHSPAGFNWGYGGSGPAQLSLALCCEVLSIPDALRVYQHFKSHHVALWVNDNWAMWGETLARLVFDLMKRYDLREVAPLFRSGQVLGQG